MIETAAYKNYLALAVVPLAVISMATFQIDHGLFVQPSVIALFVWFLLPIVAVAQILYYRKSGELFFFIRFVSENRDPEGLVRFVAFLQLLLALLPAILAANRVVL